MTEIEIVICSEECPVCHGYGETRPADNVPIPCHRDDLQVRMPLSEWRRLGRPCTTEEYEELRERRHSCG